MIQRPPNVRIVAKAPGEEQIPSIQKHHQVHEIINNIDNFSNELPIFLDAYQCRVLLYGVSYQIKSDIIKDFCKKHEKSFLSQVTKLIARTSYDDKKTLAEQLSIQLYEYLLAIEDEELFVLLKKSGQNYIAKTSKEMNRRFNWRDGISAYQNRAKKLLSEYKCDEETLKISHKKWKQVEYSIPVPIYQNHLIGLLLIFFAILRGIYLSLRQTHNESYDIPFIFLYVSGFGIFFNCLMREDFIPNARPNIPAIELDAGFSELNETFLKSFIKYNANKKKHEHKEYSDSGLNASKYNKIQRKASFDENITSDKKPKSTKTKPTNLETTLPQSIGEKKEFKDLRIKGSTYFMLENGFVRLNHVDLLALHPPGAPDLNQSIYDYVRKKRSIPPPTQTERTSHNSPFNGMDGKIRINRFSNLYRLALKKRKPNALEVLSGISLETELYTPKKVVKHGRRGY